jgi:hypothetical protein
MYTGNPSIEVQCPQYLQVFSNKKARQFIGRFSNAEDEPFSPPAEYKPVQVSAALAEIEIRYRIMWVYSDLERRRLIGRRDQNNKPEFRS